MSSAELEEDEAIDPDIARFVNAVLQGGVEHGPATSHHEQRAIAEAIRTPWRQGGPVMARTRDLQVPTPTGQIRVRVFEPDERTQDRPALIYVHGGGFVLFSLDTHDRLMREYAGRTGAVVIGVDYTLSPEARFPIALNELVAVAEWSGTEASTLGIDANRIAIGGDSVGANLSLATCLVLRERGCGDRIGGMLFNYGFFDADFDTESHRRHGSAGKLLTTDELAGYLQAYLGEDSEWTDPLALPALSPMHDLPPSFHVIATCDPLADGDRAMARRLEDAGNRVTSREYDGATHSFLEALSVSSLAESAFADSAAWLLDLWRQQAAR